MAPREINSKCIEFTSVLFTSICIQNSFTVVIILKFHLQICLFYIFGYVYLYSCSLISATHTVILYKSIT